MPGSSHPPREGYVIEHRVGRLLQARVFALRTPEEVDTYTRELGIAALRMSMAVRPILCADHRPVAIYAQPVAERLIEVFTQMNARLERVAVVVARSNATLVMQLNRIVREASYAARRVVHEVDDAYAHLAPVLEPEELASMREFLAEYTSTGEPASQRIRLPR